ncbi:hypothetical protein P43SY_005201 [Pythium insidiosum]|uniref:PA domain-containing protein n=1 Tax=Pythium insidiosum TaxID=114742 RepID=A0AAD5QBQ7_PYTIN|nr:hypothetical protein P43SY_005201 [Pythium insidiosum]
MMRRTLPVAWLLSLIVATGCVAPAQALRVPMASAVVTVKHKDISFFGSSAIDEGWGAELAGQTVDRGQRREFYPLVFTTKTLSDPFGCTPRAVLENRTGNGSLVLPPALSFVLLVDRGLCTFSEKALFAQQLGAAALLVTDTQEQAYNRSRLATFAVLRDMEYSCANGEAEVPPGVDIEDFTASTWRDTVNVRKCNSSSACSSSMCIPTGAGRKVCCLWDLPDSMGFSKNGVVQSPDEIQIPVVRLTIQDGRRLKSMLATESKLLVTIYERNPPIMDPSQFLIWLMAVITVMIGGYKGATVERERALRKKSAAAAAAAALSLHDTSSPRSIAAIRAAVEGSVRTAQDPSMEGDDDDDDAEGEGETLDLTVWHAVSFVFFATAFLLLLFYFNIVLVVIVLFALGSLSSTFQVFWQPLLDRLYFLRVKPFVRFQPNEDSWIASLQIETWTVVDLLAALLSLGTVLLWFFCRHRLHAWILQDLFGVCLCILFLRTIRLPNLKIATIMLSLVFLYDIFMVFISPFIFKESVMIKAATGGSQGAATVDDGYCLRYPMNTEFKCLKEQVPILLRLPKVIDWRGGQSMLGLGDIVLPGLLVVFCARYDYATRGQLMGRVKPHLSQLKTALEAGELGEQPPQQALMDSRPAAARRGLFGIVMWGYAIGLLMANIAVAVMQQGQPALLYIVPTTLGTLWFVAWRRGILRKLWDGPEELQSRSSRREAEVEESAVAAVPAPRAERSLTIEQVIRDSEHVAVSGADGTPQSTYCRTQDSPRS